MNRTFDEVFGDLLLRTIGLRHRQTERRPMLEQSALAVKASTLRQALRSQTGESKVAHDQEAAAAMRELTMFEQMQPKHRFAGGSYTKLLDNSSLDWSRDAPVLLKLLNQEERIGGVVDESQYADPRFIFDHFTHLDLSGRAINHLDISLSRFTRLKELDVSHNDIAVLQNLPSSIASVQAYSSNVCNVSLYKSHQTKMFSSLIHLGLGFNGVKSISKLALSCPNLLTLDVSYNELTNLEEFTNELQHFPHLRKLRACGNPCSVTHGYLQVILEKTSCCNGGNGLEEIDGLSVSGILEAQGNTIHEQQQLIATELFISESERAAVASSLLDEKLMLLSDEQVVLRKRETEEATVAATTVPKSSKAVNNKGSKSTAKAVTESPLEPQLQAEPPASNVISFAEAMKEVKYAEVATKARDLAAKNASRMTSLVNGSIAFIAQIDAIWGFPSISELLQGWFDWPHESDIDQDTLITNRSTKSSTKRTSKQSSRKASGETSGQPVRPVSQFHRLTTKLLQTLFDGFKFRVCTTFPGSQGESNDNSDIFLVESPPFRLVADSVGHVWRHNDVSSQAKNGEYSDETANHPQLSTDELTLDIHAMGEKHSQKSLLETTQQLHEQQHVWSVQRIAPPSVDFRDGCGAVGIEVHLQQEQVADFETLLEETIIMLIAFLRIPESNESESTQLKINEVRSFLEVYLKDAWSNVTGNQQYNVPEKYYLASTVINCSHLLRPTKESASKFGSLLHTHSARHNKSSHTDHVKRLDSDTLPETLPRWHLENLPVPHRLFLNTMVLVRGLENIRATRCESDGTSDQTTRNKSKNPSRSAKSPRKAASKHGSKPSGKNGSVKEDSDTYLSDSQLDDTINYLKDACSSVTELWDTWSQAHSKPTTIHVGESVTFFHRGGLPL